MELINRDTEISLKRALLYHSSQVKKLNETGILNFQDIFRENCTNMATIKSSKTSSGNHEQTYWMGNFIICSHSILSWSATPHQQSNTHVRLLNHRSKTNLFVCQALKLLGSHKRFSFAALKTKYRWLKVGSGKSIMIKLVLCFRLQKDFYALHAFPLLQPTGIRSTLFVVFPYTTT